ncbi:Endoribonuclease L-PSP/chorismate mutase-like protein [Rhodotorula diobovata]|uniref:Endoribonuclease L-PSP/chorismate mutase-like protein n=1 Tax=Rhodotorula diobovata TaxID=5288 RepID=A0A5C5G0A8_9BASI|nr:Endoribonuclease L-PSP/chorismate mutase-like protein [Rhodotorula diobovata]
MSAVTTHNAESPGPFLTQAVLAPPGSTLYVSGQCAVDPKTGKCVEGTVADRTTQVLKNLAEVLKAGGMDLGDVVMVNVYLTNHAEDMEPMNEAYMRAFEGFSSPMPARTCVGVSHLPLDTDVEISCVAVKRPAA